MAEFCNICANRLRFETDIDIEAEVRDLNEGHYRSGYICEGCGMVALGILNGKIMIARLEDVDDNGDMVWQEYDPDYIPKFFRND